MKSKLLKDLWSFTAMALMIVGIGGIAFNMFRDNGWLKKIVGAVWDAEMRNPIIVTPVILFAVWIAWLALGNRLELGKSNRFADALVLGLSLLGLYFLIDWLTG